MLAAMAAIVPTLGHNRVNPAVDLSPIAQTISSSAATSRNNQDFMKGEGELA